ncbi:hypothetical protein [Mediterraneibacter gnavus]|uniref:hypothetical protein n=1 Tax=Mediterraneibacter gnavus TaxID=33038 RepID=UPI000E473C9F|nr:hypothetical protein [Mediterraneibacter gnavus]RHB98371.1 hypothetical protein DW865_06155 [Mediterraneibacter gnavus]
MTRETMKRRRETTDTVRKIEAHKMATRKPCETALKQQGHKAFACDFKSRERTNKDVAEYMAEKYNIKERIPGGDRVGQERDL